MLATAFALLLAVAGWYYMFHSGSAAALAEVEGDAANRRRVRLRRAGGVAMFLLGVCFYAGFYAVDADRPTVGFYLVWLAVMVLLMAVVILGIIDLYLTWKLRRCHRT